MPILFVAIYYNRKQQADANSMVGWETNLRIYPLRSPVDQWLILSLITNICFDEI